MSSSNYKQINRCFIVKLLRNLNSNWGSNLKSKSVNYRVCSEIKSRVRLKKGNMIPWDYFNTINKLRNLSNLQNHTSKSIFNIRHLHRCCFFKVIETNHGTRCQINQWKKLKFWKNNENDYLLRWGSTDSNNRNFWHAMFDKVISKHIWIIQRHWKLMNRIISYNFLTSCL